MRDILFCGKAVDNGEFLNCKGKWVEGGITFFKGGTPYICPERFSDYDEEIEVDPDTVSEFTGLTDKNGTKIFEGHIVLAKVGLHTYMGIVKYDEKCAMFVVEAFGRYKNKTEHTDKLCFSCEYITEVIGNKWDNPELLEGGAE